MLLGSPCSSRRWAGLQFSIPNCNQHCVTLRGTRLYMMALSLLRKFYIFRGVPVVHINIKRDTKTGMAGPEWSPIDEDTERHRTTQWLLEDWMNHPPVHSALLVVFLYLSRTHAFFVDFVLLPAASVRLWECFSSCSCFSIWMRLEYLHMAFFSDASKILSIVLVGIYWLNWIDLYWFININCC